MVDRADDAVVIVTLTDVVFGLLTTWCHRLYCLKGARSVPFGETFQEGSMRGRYRRPVGPRYMIAAALLILAASAVTAGAQAQTAQVADPYFQFGYSQQNGGCCGGEELDGWRADIQSNLDPHGALNCLIASISERNNAGGSTSSARQLEAGDVRCGLDSGGLDGTCSTASERAKFIEQWFGNNNYDAYCHGLYDESTSDRFRVTEEDPPNDARYRAWINGNPDIDLGGFTTYVSFARGWGEVSWTTSSINPSGCGVSDAHNWFLNGNFSNVARYVEQTGVFHDVNSADSYDYEVPSGTNNCLGYRNTLGSDSVFDVTG